MRGVENDPDWLVRELAKLAKRKRAPGTPESEWERLGDYSALLQRLLRRLPATRAGLSHLLAAVSRVSSAALRVQRASVWLCERGGAVLRCVVEIDSERDVEAPGTELQAAAVGRYLGALWESSALAVEDARSDPRVEELSAYLATHGVGALLDVPMEVRGEHLGVVCHEHTGESRAWTKAEVAFCAQIGSLVAISLETDRRVSAELAAQGTEAKYRHLVESLPVTVYSFDLDTRRLSYVSPRMQDLGGFAAEELLSLGVGAWLARIDPADRPAVLRRMAQGESAGLPSELRYRIEMPDGGQRWVRDSCSVVRDEVGRPVVIQGVLADISEQQAAENERREFERRYRRLLENVDLLAITVDETGHATFVNDSFARVTGYSREQLTSGDWFELVIPAEMRDSIRQRVVRAIAQGSVPQRYEVEIQTRSGERRTLTCASTPLRGPSGVPEGAATLSVDITERRRLDDAVREQSKLESLGRLAASVAHDFNNLLTVMGTQLELLRFNGELAAPSTATLDQALAQAAALTESLLVYGRREPGRVEVLELDALLDESRPLIGAVAPSDVQLAISLEAAGQAVRADRAQLRQLLLNLVSNAVDATRAKRRETTAAGSGLPLGEVRVSTTVEWVDDSEARRQGARHGGDFVVLSVADEGVGMDDVTRDRLFEPFYTTKADGAGTGLGLAIVKTVVEARDGFVHVESLPGLGATFRVFLPRATGAERGSIPPAHGREPINRNVIVVSGDQGLRDELCEVLHGEHLLPMAVDNLETAIGILATEDVGLVLTDEHLRDGSARVLARSLLTVRPATQVLLLGKRPGAELGLDGQIETPSDRESVRAAVRAALSAGARE